MKKIKIVLVLTFIFIGSMLFKLFYINTNNNNSIKYNIMIIDNQGTRKSNSFPDTNAYIVNVTCTSGKGTVTWNPKLATPAWEFKFENGYTNNTRTSIASNDSCNIVFSARSSSDKLSTYIKSLLNGRTSVTSGNGTLKNEGSSTGVSISNGTANYYHDKGIRYEGANPDNYIKFNNELWRIIGIFREAKTSALTSNDIYYTKIIRNESIGGYAINGVNSNGGWWSKSSGTEVSTLNYLLNHYYIGAADDGTYNNIYDGTGSTNCIGYYVYSRTNCDYRVIGIQPRWRDMIINTTWYTAVPTTSITLTSASTAFSGERGSTVGKAGGDLSYTAKVGLMYPSDYLYSGSAASTRWLLQNGSEWTISPSSSNPVRIWAVEYSSLSTGNSNSSSLFAVSPTVYLSDSVYITGGTGSLLDPYTIAM